MQTIGLVLAILYLAYVVRKLAMPAALREARATYWEEPNLARFKSIAAKLAELKSEIEDNVGLTDQAGAVANLEEGDLGWDDFVEPGFEKERKLWLKAQKEYIRITREIAELERHEQIRRLQNIPAERLRIPGSRDQLAGPRKPLP